MVIIFVPVIGTNGVELRPYSTCAPSKWKYVPELTEIWNTTVVAPAASFCTVEILVQPVAAVAPTIYESVPIV